MNINSYFHFSFQIKMKTLCVWEISVESSIFDRNARQTDWLIDLEKIFYP